MENEIYDDREYMALEETVYYWTSTHMYEGMAYSVMLTKMQNGYGDFRWDGLPIRPVTEES